MVVIADKAGRLGNRLLVFAHVIATSLEYGFEVANPAFDEYAPHFVGTRSDLLARFPPRRASGSRPKWLRRLLYYLTFGSARLVHRVSGLLRPWVDLVRVPAGTRLDLGDPALIERLSRARVALFQGWLLRNEEALIKHADEVRRFLAPIDPIAERAQDIVARLREGCDLVVGIHIRQDDYRGHLGGRYFFPTSSYVQLMSAIERCFDDNSVGFLVCSDTNHEQGVFAPHMVRFGSGHFVEDMHALSSCDLLVGPPSSFTFWASFYGEVPLYVVIDPDRPVAREDFAVAPTILDEQVRALY